MLVKVIDPVDGPEGSANALREAYVPDCRGGARGWVIATGLSAPEIAVALGVSASTVRTHLAAFFDKTGLRSQLTLARLIGVDRARGKRHQGEKPC